MEFSEATWGDGVVEGIENMLEHALERVPTVHVLHPVPTLQCAEDVRYRSFTDSDTAIDRVGAERDFVFQKHHPCPSNYHTLLPRLVKGSDEAAAAQFKLFNSMVSMSPDEIVHAFALSRRLGVPPSRACYHRAFAAFSSAGAIDLLLDAFDDMLVDGITVRPSTYKTLFDACFHAGHSHVAVCLAVDAACTSSVQITQEAWSTLFRVLVSTPHGSDTSRLAEDLAVVVPRLEAFGASALRPIDYGLYCRQLIAAGQIKTAVNVFRKHVAPHVADFRSDSEKVIEQLANELIIAVCDDEDCDGPSASSVCKAVTTFVRTASLEYLPGAYLGMLALAYRTHDVCGLEYFVQMRARGIPLTADAFLAACRLATAASTDPRAGTENLLRCPASVYMWRCFIDSYRVLRSCTDGEQGSIWMSLLRCCTACHDIVTAVHVLNMAFVLQDVRVDRRPLVREFVQCASSPSCSMATIKLYEASRVEPHPPPPQGMLFVPGTDAADYSSHVEGAFSLARKLDVPVIKCLLSSTDAQHPNSLELEELFAKLWKRGLGQHVESLLTSESAKKDRSPITEWYVSVIDQTALQSLSKDTEAAVVAMMQQYAVRGGAAFLLGVDALAMLGKAYVSPAAAILSKWLKLYSNWCSIIPFSILVQIQLRDSGKAQLIRGTNWGCVWAASLKQVAKRVILLTQDEEFLRVATEEFRVRPAVLFSQLLQKLRSSSANQ